MCLGDEIMAIGNRSLSNACVATSLIRIALTDRHDPAAALNPTDGVEGTAFLAQFLLLP